MDFMPELMDMDQELPIMVLEPVMFTKVSKDFHIILVKGRLKLALKLLQMLRLLLKLKLIQKLTTVTMDMVMGCIRDLANLRPH